MAAQFAFGFRVKRAWNGHEIGVFVHDTWDMERLSEKEVVFQFWAFWVYQFNFANTQCYMEFPARASQPGF